MPKPPFDNGARPYAFQGVEDYWPRRLLHIKSMKSVERDVSGGYQDPDTREVHTHPSYSILTYTWGRYAYGPKDRDIGPAIKIEDVKWTIPSIKPDKFSVDDFQRVVDTLKTDNIEWAWIDVACIHQCQQSPENAEEVGHQASIFNKAKFVYVWLWSLSTDTLKDTIADIINYGVYLGEHVHKRHPETKVPVHEIIKVLRKTLDRLFDDKWFSSLWTLQEITMRRDAIVLSKEAEMIIWDDSDYFTHFTMLVNHCQNMWQDIQKIEYRADRWNYPDIFNFREVIKPEIAVIKERLESAGFYYLFSDNPNVQYGTAKYRQTTLDNDRIYAIMQIYNIRVGKSARPPQNPVEAQEPIQEQTFEQLKIEFGREINRQCPILGQFYIHSKLSKQTATWCITEESMVPDMFMTYREPKSRCDISITKLGFEYVDGYTFLLTDLVDLFKYPSQPDPSTGTDALFLDQYIHAALSHSAVDSHAMLSDCLSAVPALSDRYGRENLRVLWLGSLKAPPSRERGEQQQREVGLVICPSHPDGPGVETGTKYYRYGIYTWMMYTDWIEAHVNKLKQYEPRLELN